jgi:virginiamycin A acetyltransferase
MVIEKRQYMPSGSNGASPPKAMPVLLPVREPSAEAANSVNARLVLKRLAQSVALAVVFPSALLCGFGRIERLYTLFAQLQALIPGFIGDYCRAAFYKLTLQRCSIDTTIAFGTFFSRRTACVGPFVSIGAFCVIGCVRIGARTQIASHVEMPGGRRGHARDAEGRLSGLVDDEIMIGADCWVGSSAVVMANVGPRTTIGAGSVVVEEIPAGVVAVGNPAKVIRSVYAEMAE